MRRLRIYELFNLLRQYRRIPLLLVMNFLETSLLLADDGFDLVFESTVDELHDVFDCVFNGALLFRKLSEERLLHVVDGLKDIVINACSEELVFQERFEVCHYLVLVLEDLIEIAWHFNL